MPRRRDEYDERDLQSLLDSAILGFLRLSPRMRAIVVVVLAAALIIGVYAYVQSQRRQEAAVQEAAAASPDMLLGNPSAATPDPSNRNNYLMVKPYYALSYNDSKGTANWVSWHVTPAYLGDAPRKQIFDPDDMLPPGFYRVTHKDYSGSGFDRGHLCPHSDRAANQEMSFATFVMTNVIPQAHHVNEKAWAHVEIYCRDLVRHHQDHLYIVAGPTGQGGRGSHGFAQTIAGGRVVVPAECWKVIVVVPQEGSAGGSDDDDLGKITPHTRVITVMMPNDDDVVGEQWAPYRTSPADVERRTGLHFFDRLSPAVAQLLRQKIDDTPLPIPRSLTHHGG